MTQRRYEYELADDYQGKDPDEAYDQVKEKINSKVQEERKQMKFMFQLISAEHGRRTDPFVTNYVDLADALKKDNDVSSDDYILLVAVLDGENTQIPTTPLITVGKFLEIQENS